LNFPDLAIYELPQELPESIERYDIYRDSAEQDEVAIRVSFGMSGEDRIQSHVRGTKRIGVNRYDIVEEKYLEYDFDDDDPSTPNSDPADRRGIHGDPMFSEVIGAHGDSGGPAFIDGKIAGIAHSGHVSLTLLAYNNVGTDSRVSYAADWIDSIIDEPGLPTVTNVKLRGSSWAQAVDHAFDDLVAEGKQLRPIPAAGVNTIEIAFSEHVLMNGSELVLALTERLANGSATNSTLTPDDFSYDVPTHTATWTFNTDLDDGKYAIHLADSITDTGKNRLDGEWDNGAYADHGTTDDYSDDVARTFSVGNGVEGSVDNEFRLHFALLAYDYTGDGVVDSADTTEWQRQINQGIDDPAADANGDGLVNASDNPATSAQGHKLPLLPGGGDFNDDEYVGAADIFKFIYFPNMSIDAPDYSNLYLDQSAWYQGDSGVTPTVNANAPKVSDVVVSSSSSTSGHTPYSFAGVVGTGAQLGTVPVGEADTVTIVFSESVNVSADSLRVIGLREVERPELVEFNYDTNTHAGTWKFTNWIPNDHYMLSLSDTVTDVDGDYLDGEWTNPESVNSTNSSGLISTFTTNNGNGAEGGAFKFVITLLGGDYSLDNTIAQADLDKVLLSWGIITDTSFANGDFNGDGQHSQDDLDPALLYWGINLQDLTIVGNGSGSYTVSITDLQLIASNFNTTNATGDLNGDGQVDLDDFEIGFALFVIDLVRAA